MRSAIAPQDVPAMKTFAFAFLVAIVSAPLAAQERRALEAHVHGVSELQIAIDGERLEIDLHAPGFDIVGFEHEAASLEDKDAVAAAIRVLSRPENVVDLPDAAQCRLAEALAHLHDDDGDHLLLGRSGAREPGQGRGERRRAALERERDGALHSEFHARYRFDCANPGALLEIALPFFEQFAGAEKIRAQFASARGVIAADITPDAPRLALN